MMQDVSIQLSSRARFAAGFLVGLGVITAVYGIMVAPERTWPNLLLNGFYIASVGVSAMFFLATQRVTGARWSASL
jgi:protein-S-isoprenylcysteine O-methyltransferase Ste14